MNTNKFVSVCKSYLAIILTVFVVFAIGCDGGIRGSGNGGGDIAGNSSTPKTPIPVLAYSMKHLPQEIALEFPDSLQKLIQENINLQQPSLVLTDTILEVRDLLLRFGVVQLYIDRMWQEIQDYCLATNPGVVCELSDSGISFVYTGEMAIWESQLRQKLSGEPEFPDQTGLPLHDEPQRKIGATIDILSGAFQVLVDEEYDYLVRLALPEFDNGDVLYQLMWNEEAIQVEVSLGDFSADTPVHFRSTYQAAMGQENENQMFVLTTTSGENQKDVQYSQYHIDEEAGVFLESHATVVNENGKTETFSRGVADDEGAFLESETTIVDENSETTRALQRELVGAEYDYSIAECVVTLSPDTCISNTDWNLQVGSEPALSEYYLTQLELDLLSSEFNPDIGIPGAGIPGAGIPGIGIIGTGILGNGILGNGTGAPSISASHSVDTIEVTWVNGSSYGWVGLFVAGDSDTNYQSFFYTDSASGSGTFDSNLSPGQYEVRLFNGYRYNAIASATLEM